jgi:phosphoglycolate phosphatase
MPQTADRSILRAVRLLIYDLDGTLVDAFADIRSGVNHALATVGLAPLPLETVKSFVGDGARRLIERCLGDSGAPHLERVYCAFLDYYASHPAESARPYEGAAETLASLRALGLRQAVLTNKPEAISRALCERLGLAMLLDGVWGERPGVPLKPDPESVLRVARHFAIEPPHCAVIGDGPADHAVARAAGTRLIAVTFGQMRTDQVRAAGPDAIVDRLPELVELFRRV